MSVPDRSWFDPVLNATLHTGRNARQAVAGMPLGVRIAADIETPGLSTFTINCVTAAWDENGHTHAVLLDPRRDTNDERLTRVLLGTSGEVIFHNAPFDIPILWHARLIDADVVSRVVDTLVLARLADPDPFHSKTLTKLVGRHLGWADFDGGMELAFKAAGYKTHAAGYEGMDIDSPVYRLGAMADTVATLRLEPLLRDEARHWLTDHPFAAFGAATAEEADALIAAQERVNRVMLRRSARGLGVDLEYLTKYAEKVDTERALAAAELARAGLEGGSGKGAALVAYLDQIGELPADWPLTPSGKLRATKADLDALEHPLAHAQRTLAATDKVLGYIEKVVAQAEVTGRCHPQVNVLGASQTGRMSYGSPELHQFSADARPIICDDGAGLTSVDWAQIEPVTMALMAGDAAFLAPFEAGADLYEPIQRSAGIDRPTAKVVLLAAMYGQGINKLSRTIGHTTESSQQIRRQMFSAMPQCAKWMSQVTSVAERHGRVITAGGRILPVTTDGSYKSVNHVVQGSAYDVLADTILRLEDAGLGDAVYIAMHDELVVSTEHAAEVQRIMTTPPEFLCRWAGRTPVLRTDRADMGGHWAKV